MKGTPAALITHMQQPVTSMAGCWRLQRTDGQVFTFTEHPADLVVDAETYKAATGFSRTAIAQSEGLGVDNLDLQGLLSSGDITESDIRANRYRDAQVWYFEVNWRDISLGLHKLDYGFIGEIGVHGGIFVAEFRSLAQRLDQEIGEKYGRICRVELGSAACGVVLDPPVWQAGEAVTLGVIRKASSYDALRYVCTKAGTTNDTEGEPTWDTTPGNTTVETDGVEWQTLEAWTKQGAITAVSSRRLFVDTGRSEADNWFQYGQLTWTSGLNDGLSMDVKRSLADGTLELKFPMPFTVAAGDDYDISAGCNHQLKAPGDTPGGTYTGHCRSKFDNGKNFRAECEIPGQDSILVGA